MNSLNSNNEPYFGTRKQWGIHACLWMLAIVVSILTAKGCNDNADQPHLFISNETNTTH